MSEPIPFPALSERDESQGREPASRERVIAIVREQSDESSYDDILRELAFERLVHRGLGDLASGYLLDTADVLATFKKWQR